MEGCGSLNIGLQYEEFLGSEKNRLSARTDATLNVASQGSGSVERGTWSFAPTLASLSLLAVDQSPALKLDLIWTTDGGTNGSKVRPTTIHSHVGGFTRPTQGWLGIRFIGLGNTTGISYWCVGFGEVEPCS